MDWELLQNIIMELEYLGRLYQINQMALVVKPLREMLDRERGASGDFPPKLPYQYFLEDRGWQVERMAIGVEYYFVFTSPDKESVAGQRVDGRNQAAILCELLVRRIQMQDLETILQKLEMYKHD